MTGPRIKIYCRSFNLKLYRLSKGLYEGMGYPCVRLTDKSADGYFYAMLRDTDCDIAVNIDEDAFVVDPGSVEELIRTLREGGYANIGISDWRDTSVTNPFFNVFDLKAIRSSFDKDKLVSSLEDKEPYFPFFHWLNDNFTSLRLPTEKHADGASTIVKTPGGKVVCKHSWFARFYNLPDWMVRFSQKNKGRQKLRIDALIREVYAERGMELPHFGPADELSFAGNLLARWLVKIPQRISRWPHKIKVRVLRTLKGV